MPMRFENLAAELYLVRARERSGSRDCLGKKELEVLERPETLSSGLTMNQRVSRARCLLAILWMRLDMCRNLVANRNMTIKDAPSASSSSESWWEVVERTDLSSGSRS